MQDWLELGKGCGKAPRAKGKVTGVEIDRDDAMHYDTVNELQTVAPATPRTDNERGRNRATVRCSVVARRCAWPTDGNAMCAS